MKPTEQVELRKKSLRIIYKAPKIKESKKIYCRKRYKDETL